MEFEEARFKAIKYLGISKKTKYEVEVKLKKSNFDESVINKVIMYLTDLGYINDEEYVNSYIRQNERMLKYSVYEISGKLKNKGVNLNIIEEKMSYLKSIQYEKKVIQKIINQKSKVMNELKLKQYLYRRGFNNFKYKGE